jgi:hypothetical protein
VNGTVTQLTILWPLGTGPAGIAGTPRLYKLPFGWLRPAMRLGTKAAKYAWLGALRGQDPRDIQYQGQYFTADTGTNGGLANVYVDLDFIADIADITVMPPQFCESLAIRLGMEIDGVLNEGKNTEKLERAYKRITGEAMRVDAILQGTPTQELEELIIVRW